MSKPERASESAIVADESSARTKPNARPAARLAAPTDDAAPSPARLLQLKLEAADLSQTKDDDGVRWAPRSTLLLAGGVSVLLWSAIAWAVGLHL